MHFKNTYHISYCTNIHPGENWETTFISLKDHVPSVKASVAKDQAFGLGLRLSNTASEELGLGDRLHQFKEWLDNHQLYVFTMNGFPYGNFHKERVKDMVHAPDWTTEERVNYTKRLFRQLAVLSPNDISAGISTSPISYKHWFASENELNRVCTTGAINMISVVLELIAIEEATGKSMHLDIEPEPDGILENSDEVVHFFNEYLIPTGVKILGDKLGKSEEEAKNLVLKYITVCYDVCHFSLAYEAPEETIPKLQAAGIGIGKIQVSSALKILFEEENREKVWDSLAQFNEPIYLHQVTVKTDAGVKTYNDLPAVLERKENFTEIRAHYHVPIFLEQYNELYATQDQILEVLAYLKQNKFTDQLEVETYTWDVLPAELKLDIDTSISREINWLKEQL